MPTSIRSSDIATGPLDDGVTPMTSLMTTSRDPFAMTKLLTEVVVVVVVVVVAYLKQEGEQNINSKFRKKACENEELDKIFVRNSKASLAYFSTKIL